MPENPLEPTESLQQAERGIQVEEAHPPQPPLPEDSAVTKAEKIERNGPQDDNNDGPSPKKRKVDEQNGSVAEPDSRHPKGLAPVKPEYIVQTPKHQTRAPDDDAEEASHRTDDRDKSKNSKKKQKQKGQNTNRSFGSSKDAIQLCSTRATQPEFSPRECQYGDNCRFEHDLRKYLEQGKREDLQTFGGKCPAFEARGRCGRGWKCRFVGSHKEEVELEDGRTELRLVENREKISQQRHGEDNDGEGVYNIISGDTKADLMKKRYKTEKSDKYLEWMDKQHETKLKIEQGRKGDQYAASSDDDVQEMRAAYVEPPFLPSEKRRLYFGPETPVLAPLTTQGNMPFRRLCIDLGAQITYSEMAMGVPLIQGNQSEWALMRAHESELQSPIFQQKGRVVQEYDNSRDLRFGAQIAANKPWQALRTTEILTSLAPHLRCIDLNCGCPIDLVYRTGAGSALLDAQPKLEKILRGMNAVSGEVPITAKIRLGTKDNRPNALKLAQRLVNGGADALSNGEGPPGVTALTLHGRSRQQRYTKSADWNYIAECAALIKRLNEERDNLTDTAREADPRHSNGNGVYFLGNGDCFSHHDYETHIRDAKVDSVMIGRGALIKPWIFEEIEKGQYLDKSSSERLGYIERFARYGLETWGSDEMGVGTTRRFLLEYLSFAHRYVPIGILEHLPPRIQDRPPIWKGRDELETLLGSDNYKDWIKISEMFLGPAHQNFKFEPKHKSNSYEIEAEG